MRISATGQTVSLSDFNCGLTCPSSYVRYDVSQTSSSQTGSSLLKGDHRNKMKKLVMMAFALSLVIGSTVSFAQNTNTDTTKKKKKSKKKDTATDTTKK